MRLSTIFVSFTVAVLACGAPINQHRRMLEVSVEALEGYATNVLTTMVTEDKTGLSKSFSSLSASDLQAFEGGFLSAKMSLALKYHLLDLFGIATLPAGKLPSDLASIVDSLTPLLKGETIQKILTADTLTAEQKTLLSMFHGSKVDTEDPAAIYQALSATEKQSFAKALLKTSLTADQAESVLSSLQAFAPNAAVSFTADEIAKFNSLPTTLQTTILKIAALADATGSKIATSYSPPSLVSILGGGQ